MTMTMTKTMMIITTTTTMIHNGNPSLDDVPVPWASGGDTSLSNVGAEVGDAFGATVGDTDAVGATVGDTDGDAETTGAVEGGVVGAEGAAVGVSSDATVGA